MATYTIELPADTVDYLWDEFLSSAKPSLAGAESTNGDAVGAARRTSTDVVARVRSAYDDNPARTFLIAVASLAGVVAVISTLARHS